VAAPDGDLSYVELYEQASALATQLRLVGVADGDLVALCVERSTSLVAAALGIREAGAAYVALDPAHPDRRLQELLADCGASAVVFGPGIGQRLGFEPFGGAGPRGLDIAPLPVRQPDRTHPGLAYVVYTSGSSGDPKGVMVTQAGLANLISWHCSEFELTSADRCTQIAAPGFDALAWEVWPCLTAGASLHVAPEQIRTDAVAMRDWLIAERITVSFMPTPLAESLLALDWPATTELRLLLTGGDRMHRRPPPGLPFEVVNNYGVSEATVVSTSGVVSAGDEVPSIGRPINGVSIRIVDENLQPVADGDSGELLVGGVSLAHGYLGRSDLTTERFIRELCPGDSDGQWYRTGDVVRQLPNGELAFLGRADDQIKIRGNRVEPGEVAAFMERHADVERCVVVAVADASGGHSLVAFVQSQGPTSPADADLRRFAAQHLPTAMLPARFVFVDAMPITTNGKVDTAALAALADGAPAVVAPGDVVEQEIAQMVAEVLGVQAVSVSDNFILLGGDSLMAARLMVRIVDRFDVELPLRTVFEHPTVVELADQVRQLT
jgi:amino acid adenylation domain-containing protein